MSLIKSEGSFKIPQNKWKNGNKTANLWDTEKVVPREKFIANGCYIANYTFQHHRKRTNEAQN